MKIQLNGEWHQMLGEGPTPREVHELFEAFSDVDGIREDYPTELASMYRANGYIMDKSEIEPPKVPTRLRVLGIQYQWEYGRIGYIGPAIEDSTVQIGKLALWLPREIVRNQ